MAGNDDGVKVVDDVGEAVVLHEAPLRAGVALPLEFGEWLKYAPECTTVYGSVQFTYEGEDSWGHCSVNAKKPGQNPVIGFWPGEYQRAY